MKKCKYLVLGGGISGLFFGNRYKNEDFIILEKDSECGGYCRTIKRNGYIWDYAGHFFHFTNEQLKNEFKNIFKDSVKRIKNTKIFYKSKLIDYPFQKNIHQLPKQEMIECLVGLFEKIECSEYSNFLQMLYGKFGVGITEKFLKPYNEKLYACDLNKLDVEAMGRFFPYANIKDIILNMKTKNNTSYNNEFYYPKEGAQSYIDHLLKNINQEKISLNENVEKIDIFNKIVYTNKNIYNYEFLISSIPLNKFLKKSDIHTNTEFSYNKVLVFNLGFDKESLNKDIHWIYVPDKKINFYRIGFYNNIIGSEKLSMYVEIGFSENDDINIDKELSDTLSNLKKMKIIDEHKLVDYNALIMDPAYVHITKESLKTVNKLKEDMEKIGIYFIGRYGKWTYCSIEDCMKDVLELKL